MNLVWEIWYLEIKFHKGLCEKNQELVPAQKVGMDWLYGCGEMYTTVGDMKKLDEAIINMETSF